MQCQGRFAKTEAFFEGRLHRNKPLLFLLPSRCKASAKELCQGCLTKRESTNNSLEKRGNKYIPNQGSLLHGTILEPIPDWSRLYNGVWFQKQIDNGYTLTEETRMKVEEALKILNGDMEMPKVQTILKPLKEKPVKLVKEKVVKATKKKVEPEPLPVAVEPVEPVPVEPVAVEPVAVEPLLPEKKKMTRKTIKKEPNQEPVKEEPVEEPKEEKPKPESKKAKEEKPKPKKPSPSFKVLNETPLDVEFVEVKVRPTEIDGRKVYVGDRDKVYDLKFNYLGRKKDEEIDSSYPDSD